VRTSHVRVFRLRNASSSSSHRTTGTNPMLATFELVCLSTNGCLDPLNSWVVVCVTKGLETLPKRADLYRARLSTIGKPLSVGNALGGKIYLALAELSQKIEDAAVESQGSRGMNGTSNFLVRSSSPVGSTSNRKGHRKITSEFEIATVRYLIARLNLP
jgi:hypothetical protein